MGLLKTRRYVERRSLFFLLIEFIQISSCNIELHLIKLNQIVIIIKKRTCARSYDVTCNLYRLHVYRAKPW